MKNRIVVFLRQIDRMAINGWSEGIDPRGQCEKIHGRIKEFAASSEETGNPFLILRLTNAAIACDARGDHNLAELITEAIKEIENGDQFFSKAVHNPVETRLIHSGPVKKGED